jgi:hypothetical protein
MVWKIVVLSMACVFDFARQTCSRTLAACGAIRYRRKADML